VNSVRHRSGPIGVRPLIAEVASLGALGRRPCGSGGHPGGSETMSIAQRAGCATPGKPPDTIGGEENPVAIGTTWTRFRLPAHAGAADGAGRRPRGVACRFRGEGLGRGSTIRKVS